MTTTLAPSPTPVLDRSKLRAAIKSHAALRVRIKTIFHLNHSSQEHKALCEALAKELGGSFAHGIYMSTGKKYIHYLYLLLAEARGKTHGKGLDYYSTITMEKNVRPLFCRPLNPDELQPKLDLYDVNHW